MIFIYALVCPESQEIRYIGKTKNIETRLASHIAKAKCFHTKNHCATWIRSLLNRGMRPTIVSIEELADGTDWQQAESLAIATHRAAGHRLTNSTSGGDGFHDMLPETIAKARATWKETMSDPIRMARFQAAAQKARNTPEVRRKQSDSLKARWADEDKKATLLRGMNTPEALARKSQIALERHADPVYSANHSATMKELWNTPERKEEAKQRSLKAWSNPEITDRRVAAIKATYATDEMKERMREVGREIGSRPEVKAKKSAKSKAYAADPARFATRLAAMSSPETRAKMSASAKARFAKPGAKAYLSTPEARARMSESAKRREEKKRSTTG